MPERLLYDVSVPTPHIEAEAGAFADTVLMPGDPLRAKYIAEKHLDNAELVTNVRAMSGYTGTFGGTRVSVMASGMGMPSAAIYITELFREYEVGTIIRIGTTGAYQPDLKLRQLIAAQGATTNSLMPDLLSGITLPLMATHDLLSGAVAEAKASNLDLHVGTVFTSDIFYEPDDDARDAMTSAGVLCVEMETAALYAIAALERKRALSLLTVSDHLVTGEHLSSDDRQKSLDEMIQLGLRVATAS